MKYLSGKGVLLLTYYLSDQLLRVERFAEKTTNLHKIITS